jgi:hypothetical protein
MYYANDLGKMISENPNITVDSLRKLGETTLS